MKKLAKKYFVPHPGNENRPHLLRAKATFIILGVVVAAEAIFLITTFVVIPRSPYFASVLSNVLVDNTNGARVSAEESALQVNPVLEEAARLKAEDMVARGYFAHVDPDGREPWYWLDKVGYSYTSAGENLAVNFIDSGDLSNAWMNSAGHRSNILNRNYTEIGIAVVPGMYKGRETSFVVQFFGRPKLVQAAAISEPKPIAEASSPPAGVPPTVTSPSEIVVNPTPEVKSAVTEEQETNVSKAAPLEAAPDRATIPEHLLSTPRKMVGSVYLILGAMVLLALTIVGFAKAEKFHQGLMVNGVFVLIVVTLVVVLNSYIALSGARIF